MRICFNVLAMELPTSPDDWALYYQRTNKRPPRQLLLDALAFRQDEAPAQAIDLGAGAGNETSYLLQLGWHVHAIDNEQSSLERLQERNKEQLSTRLTTECARFTTLTWPTPAPQLVMAFYALPFQSAAELANSWNQIKNHIAPGGLFVGQFFGDQDEWRETKDMTFLPSTAVKAMLNGWTIHHFKEVIDPHGTLASGETKHWHYYDVIAAKAV